MAGASISWQIGDSTHQAGVTQQTLQELSALAQAAGAAGVSQIVVTAGKGQGHLSHSAGTELDVRGVNPDGSPWTTAQKVAAAEGARAAGANRFGFYPGTMLHFGKSHPGFDPAMWGARGLVKGDASRKFSDPAELAFLQGRSPFALPAQATLLGGGLSPPIPTPRPAVDVGSYSTQVADLGQGAQPMAFAPVPGATPALPPAMSAQDAITSMLSSTPRSIVPATSPTSVPDTQVTTTPDTSVTGTDITMNPGEDSHVSYVREALGLPPPPQQSVVQSVDTPAATNPATQLSDYVASLQGRNDMNPMDAVNEPVPANEPAPVAAPVAAVTPSAAAPAPKPAPVASASHTLASPVAARRVPAPPTAPVAQILGGLIKGPLAPLFQHLFKALIPGGLPLPGARSMPVPGSIVTTNNPNDYTATGGFGTKPAGSVGMNG